MRRVQVYECTGKLSAVQTSKAPLTLPPGASFEEYLSLELAADAREDLPMDVMSLATHRDKVCLCGCLCVKTHGLLCGCSRWFCSSTIAQ